jgi:hypothetical protein
VSHTPRKGKTHGAPSDVVDHTVHTADGRNSPLPSPGKTLGPVFILDRDENGDEVVRIQKSITIGKTFKDLDNVERGCGYKSLTSEEIARIRGLLRIASPKRLKSFVEDYQFDLGGWIDAVQYAYDRGYKQTSELWSVRKFPMTYTFPVHTDKKLLSKFLFGKFSPNDWSDGLSLASFVTDRQPLIVINDATREGRVQLANALKG